MNSHVICRRVRRIQGSSGSVAIIGDVLPANWKTKDVEVVLSSEMNHLAWAVWLIVHGAERAVCSGWLLISLNSVRSNAYKWLFSYIGTHTKITSCNVYKFVSSKLDGFILTSNLLMPAMDTFPALAGG